MKKLASVFLLLVFSAFLNGHEFWLEPIKFILKPGEKAGIKFRVGENFNGENWHGNKSSVEELKLFYKDVDDNLKNLLSDSTVGDSLNLQFFDEGTVMVAYQSTNKYIEISSDTFQTYLQEDGLQNAFDFRAANGLTDSIGREYYKRSVKTIFQIGAIKDSSYKQKTGLPLDIIPLCHPYGLKKGQDLPIMILFKDSVLANNMVKVWHKLNGKTEMKDLYTDANGRLQVPVSLSGKWMLSVVKMEALSDTSRADWQSYWGSLTWGYK
jgi:uncharacterized GH25 family protein